MKYKDFEDFLKDVHMKNYTGTDDDSVDAYELWLTSLNVDELIALGDEYVKSNQPLWTTRVQIVVVTSGPSPIRARVQKSATVVITEQTLWVIKTTQLCMRG